MVFRRRFTSPGKTDKHEITWSDLAADYATATVEKILASGVDVGAKVGPTDVTVGSHIKWIYIEFNTAAETITNPKVLHWVVEVRMPGMAGTNPLTYYQDARSFIIHRGMEMLPKDVGTVYKRIFTVKIPRSYQRIKQGMLIVLRLKASSTETINQCGFAIYKEQY